MATKRPAAKKPVDALDVFAELANADPRQAIALILWKARHRSPEMAIQITREDLQGLKDCTDYLAVQPAVRIFRRPAVPARAAIPPSDNNPKGVPGFQGAPAAEAVTIVMVSKGTEDTFRPIENNEADAQAADRQENLRMAKENTAALAQQVASAAAGGEFSQQLVIELAGYANTLAMAARQAG